MPLLEADRKAIFAWFEKAGKKTIIPELLSKIEKYHDLVFLWSTRFNLVSKKDLPCLIKRHVLDSLSSLDLIMNSQRVIDIGSGAGFPAIPLALVCPNVEFTLLESIHKKVLFLREVQKIVGLDNVFIVEQRLENYKPEFFFDIATIRALPNREKLIGILRSFILPGGKIVYYEKRGQHSIIEV